MLFRKNFYAYEVDIWSIGCLLAELALGQPLFSGESEVEQLFKVFNLLGSPSQAVFVETIKIPQEAHIKLPDWKQGSLRDDVQDLVQRYIPGREKSLRTIVEMRQVLGEEGMDLLSQMLEIDPNS